MGEAAEDGGEVEPHSSLFIRQAIPMNSCGMNVELELGGMEPGEGNAGRST